MKKLLLALCLVLLPKCVLGQGTQVVTVAADPVTCNTGMLYYNSTTNTLKSCGPNNTWTVAGGASVSSLPQQSAVRLATSCYASDANCFQVFQDGIVSVGATYSANTSNGTTATLLTTNDNDSGAQYLQINTAQTNIGGMFSSTNNNNATILAAFKISGSLGAPASCSGTNDQAGSAATVVVGPFTPANSGSGSILIAFAAAFAPDQTAITFSDNNGNTWNNVLSRPLLFIANESVQMAYVQNNNSGATTVTATFAANATFRSIFVCNFSGMASSGVLDAAVGGLSSSGTIFSGTLSTTGNDLLFQADRSNASASTFTVGTLGIAANTITTNASFDPSYSAANIGQKAILTTGCQSANGFTGTCNSVLANPSAQVVTVTDAHHIIVSSLITTANTAPDAHGFTGWLVTAHDDTAQYVAAFNKQVSLPGAALFLPCGITSLSGQPFNETTFPTWNVSISGCDGESGTTLVPSLDFNYPAASGGIIVNIPNNNQKFSGAPQIQVPSIYGKLEKFSIWGGGATNTKFASLPVIFANNMEIDNVDCSGFDYGSSGSPFTGSPFISGTGLRLNHVHGWLCGSNGLNYTGDGANGSGEPGSVRNSYFQPNGSGIIVGGGNLESSNNTLYGAGGSCAAANNYTVQVNGGQFTSHQDKYAGVFSTAGLSNLEADYGSSIGPCGAAINISGTGNVTSQNSLIDTFTMSAGSFNDLGGNYHTSVGTPYTNGTLSVTGGTVANTASVTGVAVVAGKLVLSAGWGTTASWTTGPTGFTKRVQGTITASGTGQAANPTITYTYPTPFAQATNIVCKGTQIGGTQGAVANPFTVGVPSATSVVFTYTGTPGAGNTLQVVLECDAS